MAGSKIKEAHTLSVEGVLNIQENDILIEVEDIGNKSLKDLFVKFDGDNVKINIKIGNDIIE